MIIIECPKCSTQYKLPDDSISDKPRKMRCSRCNNIFTITRKSTQPPPPGYQEFTGRQHLPDEFAFLKETPAEQAPKQPEQPEQPAAKTPAPTEQPAARPSSSPAGLYQSIVQNADQNVDTIPFEPPMVTGPEKPSKGYLAPDTTSTTAPTPATAPKTNRPPPAAEIYGASPAAEWEKEVPLELAGFAITDAQQEENQLVGKVMFALTVLTISFLLFVAYRNGWSISFEKLPDQISFAFSDAAHEDLPDEARDIQATITKTNVVVTKNGTSCLVVVGEATNSSIATRTHIILRGRLIDEAGDIRSEVRYPCGKTIDEELIRSTPKGSIQGHYHQNNTLYNCTIPSDDSTLFQIIFEDIPADYDSNFQIQVTAVSAQSS